MEEQEEDEGGKEGGREGSRGLVNKSGGAVVGILEGVSSVASTSTVFPPPAAARPLPLHGTAVCQNLPSFPVGVVDTAGLEW